MQTKVGDNIQLNAQLEDGSVNKYIRATVRDANGVALVGSPVSLSHIGEGLYSDDSLVMPNSQEVTATYIVYDDAAFTLLSSIHERGLDVFVRNDNALVLDTINNNVNSLLAGSGPSDLTGYIIDDGLLAASIIDDGNLAGELIDDGKLIGIIQDDELTGVLIDDGDLVGVVNDCGA